MDEFEDFFGEETVQVKNAVVKRTVENSILVDSENANITILISEMYSERQLVYLTGLAKKAGAVARVVYVFPFVAEEKNMKKGLKKFFVDNTRKDLQDFILPDCPVITLGRAIYATTFSTDITVEAFYDGVFNKTYFYSPFIKRYVYPIDAATKILGFGQSDPKTGSPIYYFDRFETEFAKRQIRSALADGLKPPARIPRIEQVEVENPNEWLLMRTENVPDFELWVAVDSETSGFEKLTCRIGNISLSFDGRTAFYLEWEKVNPRIFSKFLHNHKLIFANGKFDLLFFAYHGCDLHFEDWDTMVSGHLLNEMRSNSLKTHAFLYTLYGGYDLDLEIYKWQYRGLTDYTKIPKKLRMPYACMDAAVTYQVYKEHLAAIEKEPELYQYYLETVIPMIKVFTKAEYKGFCINWNKISETATFLLEKIKESTKAVQQAYNEPNLNVNSKQALGIMLEEHGYPCINKGKLGYYKVSKVEINEWKKLGYKEVDTLLEYSKWVSLYQTFIGEDADVDNSGELSFQEEADSFFEETGGEKKKFSTAITGLWQYKSIDGKVHTTFHPFMTHSHRHRSSNPNLQNIPKKDYESASVVRQAYVTPDTFPCKPEQADKILLFRPDIGFEEVYSGEVTYLFINGEAKAVLGKELYKQPLEQLGIRAEYEKFYSLEGGEHYIGDYAEIETAIGKLYLPCCVTGNNAEPRVIEVLNETNTVQKIKVTDLKVGYKLLANNLVVDSVQYIKTKPAYNIFECDGENLQARIAASMSQDPTLCELFLTGGDFHNANAFDMLIEQQDFIKYRITFDDGTSVDEMEWFQNEVEYQGEKLEHIPPEKVKKGYIITGKKVVKVEEIERRKIDFDEFSKDAKKGKLKSLRTISKYCFAEGTELEIESGWKAIEDFIGHGYIGEGVPQSNEPMVLNPGGTNKEVFGSIVVESCDSIKFELDDGTVFEVTPDHDVPVIRGGLEIVIKAKDVLDSDEMVDVI